MKDLVACTEIPVPHALAAVANLHILLRGMPTDPCPAATCFHDGKVIHIQGSHGGASHRGQTDDFAAVLAPAKMLAPLLPAWMEQRHTLTRQRVMGFNLGTLELVARMASQTQVFPGSLPTGCLRNDVVYHQTCSRACPEPVEGTEVGVWQ